MGLITTQSIGFGEPKPKPEQKADPKPVRGFNYAGVPMKDGEYYNGRPEHMGPEELKELPLAERRALPDYKPLKKEIIEPGVGKGGYTRSEEVRQQTRARAIAQHARARAEQGGTELQPEKKKRWYWTKERRQRAREKALAYVARQKAEQEMKKANPETESG